MSLQAVKDNFDYLASQLHEGNLRWRREVVDAFSKLLGSGYITSSIRSLWPLYPGERQAAVGYLLEVAERWRDELRDKHALEEQINEEFLLAVQGLLKYIEGHPEMPSSKLFVITDGALRWTETADPT